MAHTIPEPIRDFIVQHIQSIAQLEALLLLFNNKSGFQLQECAARLYISPADCAEALQPLLASQFIQLREGKYVFAPENAQTAHTVAELAEVYRQQLIPVTNLIHSRQERIHKFADAFRLRKDS